MPNGTDKRCFKLVDPVMAIAYYKAITYCVVTIIVTWKTLFVITLFTTVNSYLMASRTAVCCLTQHYYISPTRQNNEKNLRRLHRFLCSSL